MSNFQKVRSIFLKKKIDRCTPFVFFFNCLLSGCQGNPIPRMQPSHWKKKKGSKLILLLRRRQWKNKKKRKKKERKKSRKPAPCCFIAFLIPKVNKWGLKEFEISMPKFGTKPKITFFHRCAVTPVKFGICQIGYACHHFCHIFLDFWVFSNNLLYLKREHEWKIFLFTCQIYIKKKNFVSSTLFSWMRVNFKGTFHFIFG